MKLSSKSSLLTAPLMIACAFIASGALAMADQETATGCSNGTLSGNYGFAAQGVLLAVPGLPAQAPFRSVGMTHFDGKGNLSWVENTIINGIPLELDNWTPASGTYTIHPNCTGTAIVNTPNSPVPLSLAFVVVKGGTEVYSIEHANAILTTYIKVQ